MDLSVSPKDEIWFLRVFHHISNAVYNMNHRCTNLRFRKKGVIFLTRLGASFLFSHIRSSAVIRHMKTFPNVKTRPSKEDEEKIKEYKQDDKQENLSNLSPPLPTTSQPFSTNQTHNQHHIQTPHQYYLAELRCHTETLQSISMFLYNYVSYVLTDVVQHTDATLL